MNYRIFQGRKPADTPRPARRPRALRTAALTLALLPALASAAFAANGQDFQKVTLPPSSLNANLQQHYSGLYSTYGSLGASGDVTLGSVPFSIPVVSNIPRFSGGSRVLPSRSESNFWLGAYNWLPGDINSQATGTQSISIAPNLNQVPDVYALMGCYWGRRTSNGLANGTVISAASVTFTFVDFASVTHTYTKTLTAGPANYSLYTPFGGPLLPPSNSDIRDFHDSEFKSRYSNVINGTTTTQVYSGSFLGLSDQDDPRTYRLDMVRLSIPYPYNQMKLTGINVSDQGAWGIQRIFVGGMTSLTGHCTNMQLLNTVAGANNSYLQVYRLTNCATYQFANPLSVLLTNLTPGVTLTNGTGTATGENAGIPYVNTNIASPLLPNQSVIVTLRFTSSVGSLVGIKPFTEKLLAGPGPR
ncbi:MAG: hypothetical protein K0Q72_1331 [Armatimonadetes bacterium]|jgi:hypothetical protein|nr:hypothetical protein [Armatimonadota bacterium]